MFPSSKMSREARSQLFSFVGCLVLQKYAMGLQSNLSNWEGEQETRRGNGQMKFIFTSFGTQRKRRRWETAMGTADTASSVFSLLILLAKSGSHRYQCCCFSSDLCRTVRCPSQTEHHPQLHASCHDCSSCSNCLLLLWSLQLRCQGW